jgi:uncharacterized membrane protein
MVNKPSSPYDPATASGQSAIDPKSPVHKVELALSTILRTGVIVSLVIIIAGTVVRFIHHRDFLNSRSDTQTLLTSQAFPHTITDVFTSAMHGHSDAIVGIGLLLLILTPVLRVAASIVAFAIQRDGMFVLLTTFVLAMLILSFVLGRAGG